MDTSSMIVRFLMLRPSAVQSTRNWPGDCRTSIRIKALISSTPMIATARQRQYGPQQTGRSSPEFMSHASSARSWGTSGDCSGWLLSFRYWLSQSLRSETRMTQTSLERASQGRKTVVQRYRVFANARFRLARFHAFGVPTLVWSDTAALAGLPELTG